MYILAFETSCDDTSIALFKDNVLITMDTKTQIKEHLPTCGVVPEVAARLHANNIFLALDKVLSDSNMTLSEIDYIACTNDPGLLPSLYVGMTVAKAISMLLGKPLIYINHIEAHMFANLLEREVSDINFPAVCLTVSGGHNEIYLWKNLFERELIGATQDDSAGEAFDKVAKMMGVGFPGGPIISRLASEYEGEFKGIFPKVLLDKTSLNFSFSGLKSAVKREVDKRIEYNKKINIKSEIIINYDGEENTKYLNDIKDVNMYLTLDDKKEIAFEFEQTVIDILTTKLFLAAEKYNVESLVLAGGVSANNKLKNTIKTLSEIKGYDFIHPKTPIYSQDNAAMVGILAYYKIINS